MILQSSLFEDWQNWRWRNVVFLQAWKFLDVLGMIEFGGNYLVLYCLGYELLELAVTYFESVRSNVVWRSDLLVELNEKSFSVIDLVYIELQGFYQFYLA